MFTEIIRDGEICEFIRSAMMMTIAMLSLTDEVPRPTAVQFLRDGFDQLRPADNCVWLGSPLPSPGLASTT